MNKREGILYLALIACGFALMADYALGFDDRVAGVSPTAVKTSRVYADPSGSNPLYLGGFNVTCPGGSCTPNNPLDQYDVFMPSGSNLEIAGYIDISGNSRARGTFSFDNYLYINATGYGLRSTGSKHINLWPGGDLVIQDSGLVPSEYASDPCGTLSAGSVFTNSVSDYLCRCNASGVDVQAHDPATACF